MSGAGSSTPGHSLHVRVEGRVQAVGFRRFVERSAGALGLSGWVRNLSDGTVEVVAAGAPAALERLRERLRVGPPHATVTDVAELAVVDVPEGSGFRLLPDAAPGSTA